MTWNCCTWGKATRLERKIMCCHPWGHLFFNFRKTNNEICNFIVHKLQVVTSLNTKIWHYWLSCQYHENQVKKTNKKYKKQKQNIQAINLWVLIDILPPFVFGSPLRIKTDFFLLLSVPLLLLTFVFFVLLVILLWTTAF